MFITVILTMTDKELNWIESVSIDRKLKALEAANRRLIMQARYLLTEGDFADLEHEKWRIWNRLNTAPLRLSPLCLLWCFFSGVFSKVFFLSLAAKKNQNRLAWRVNVPVAAAYPATERWECFSCIRLFIYFVEMEKEVPGPSSQTAWEKQRGTTPALIFLPECFIFFLPRQCRWMDAERGQSCLQYSLLGRIPFLSSCFL